MLKAARTRQHILETTAPLFNIKGFAGTSLADLEAATGLTKGSLYGHFDDKEAMALAVFQYSMDYVRQQAKARIDARKTNYNKLIALVTFYADYVFNPPIPGGCPLFNNAVEVDDHHVAMRKAVAAEMMRTIAYIAQLLQSGMDAGEFAADTKPMELAYVFFSAVEGALTIARVTRSDDAMKAVVKQCKYILDQISI